MHQSQINDKKNFIFTLWFNTGGVQNWEWLDVERPIFRNFKITNIKIVKDELFDYFIYEFFFIIIFLRYLNTQNTL